MSSHVAMLPQDVITCCPYHFLCPTIRDLCQINGLLAHHHTHAGMNTTSFTRIHCYAS
jgi:hypothetical protein